MSLAILQSRSCSGIKATTISVEAHISNGHPQFNIVGLPEASVKESKDRVRSAIINCRFDFPMDRITINLAPADIPKESGRFDLPIALGILMATRQISSKDCDQYEFIGELALSGEIRSVPGVFPIALSIRSSNKKLFVPYENGFEAALAGDVSILPAKHLLEVCSHLNNSKIIMPLVTPKLENEFHYANDISDVKGQHQAKRALEICAAGKHSLLMIGPPGTGKSMLTARLPSIMPPMSEQEAMESAAITSITSITSQKFNIQNWRRRPYRAPHHTASSVALVGGGSPPRPGEISLAHHGILFLDELPEFDRRVLEALREPLETGSVTISRAARQAEFPAQFQLIAAMNPCPCGYLGTTEETCRCTSDQVLRYQSRVSGPVLDRIDLHINVPKISAELLASNSKESCGATSETIRQRTTHAFYQQLNRSGKANALLTAKEIENVCVLDKSDYVFLQSAIKNFGLSARSFHRILRVARTIADLANSENIQRNHLTEALSYRQLDRKKNRF